MGTLIDSCILIDLWLAATCIAHGHSIATSNVREFERVQGLVIENRADVG